MTCGGKAWVSYMLARTIPVNRVFDRFAQSSVAQFLLYCSVLWYNCVSIST